MTNKEAIAYFKDMNECTYGDVEPIQMAIKALEQEPCEDCISRAEAIDALKYSISIESDEGLDAYKTVIEEILCKIYDVQKENIKKLPSVQPKPNTDVLDKITEEIQTLRNCSCYCSDGIIDDVEDIIDKYRESE